MGIAELAMQLQRSAKNKNEKRKENECKKSGKV